MIEDCDGIRTAGKLLSARGLITAKLPVAVGDLCQVGDSEKDAVLSEVVGFDRTIAQIMPYQTIHGIRPGAPVVSLGKQLHVPVGEQLLGRVIDGLGKPIDGKGPLSTRRRCPLNHGTPPPLERPPIVKPFVTGQRAIDALITCGQGQRIALFAGSGVGKSTLLGEIARGAKCDLNVIALIGERGREVRPFLEECLGDDGLERSVTVVSTSEQSPLARVRAAQSAVTIADDFRKQGAHVVLLLDSLTRLAMAQREMGLLLGEPPSSRGYPPSAFQLLSNLLEQLGTSSTGVITGVLTVLVDGDDLDEPVSDAVRSIVDGHVVLDRQLAEKGHFPAVSVGKSLSRVFRNVTSPGHQAAARKVRAIRATHEEVADLIRVGAYQNGSSPQVDAAIRLMPLLDGFLTQNIGDRSSFEETVQVLEQIAGAWPY